MKTIFKINTDNRNNNFNLIRFLAATTVLYSHSFISVIGDIRADPLYFRIKMTGGGIAVDIFFLISGFLIVRSLLKRSSIKAFIWSRLLRIYPALVVAILFIVFIIGLIFTKLPVSEYLSNSGTYRYLIKNIFTVNAIRDSLPGVFTNVPFKNIISGQLWTLPYEVMMYGIMAGLGLFFLCFKNKLYTPVFQDKSCFCFSVLSRYLTLLAMNLSKNKLRCIKFTVLFLFTVSFSLNIIYHFYPSVSSIYTRLFIRFFSLFFTGATAYMYREKLYFSFWLVLPAVLILAASTFQKDVFFVVYCITLPYLVFYIAYVPINFLHNFNKFGDYSYGIYIYAFPIQQSVISLLPKITIIGMTILSFCITFILAFLSWHIIEKNALKLKNKI